MFKFGFNLLIALIVGFLSIILLIIFIQTRPKVCGTAGQTIDYLTYCGTYGPITERAGAGRTLFIHNCASCHAKDMRSDLTGPALENFFWYWNKDTNEVAKYLRNTTEYLETTTNEHLLEVDKKFGETVSSSFPDLTYEEVRAIIEYIEL